MIARAFICEVGLQFVVLCVDPARPGGMAAVAASEKKLHIIFTSWILQ